MCAQVKGYFEVIDWVKQNLQFGHIGSILVEVYE